MINALYLLQNTWNFCENWKGLNIPLKNFDKFSNNKFLDFSASGKSDIEMRKTEVTDKFSKFVILVNRIILW